MMDGQVIRGINFHAYDQNKNSCSGREEKKTEHLGDITVSVVVLVVEWESENTQLGKIVKYVSKLSF